MMLTICPSVYEDKATCDVACATMVGVSETNYHTPDSGNNLQCRTYHVTLAGYPLRACGANASIAVRGLTQHRRRLRTRVPG
jgi:hypothetical protein